MLLVAVYFLFQSDHNFQLPPVVVELQRVVDKDFIAREFSCCLNVYKAFKVFSVMLIICVENAT